MTPNQRRAICQAMTSRADQWIVRAGIGVLIALVFFPMVGAAPAVVWCVVYGVLQAAELRFQPGGSAARRLGEEGYAWACVGLVLVNNIVFGAFGAGLAVNGSLAGLICSSLLTCGAMINAVTVSHASRRLLTASLLPQAGYLLLLPIGAHQAGLPWLACFQIVLAAFFILVAALVTAERLAGSLRSMEAAQTAAEQANAAKSQFLATISHEIRTPLNGILGMAQVMSADDLSDRQRERLQVVSQSGQALLTILSDVLDLAKIESGRMEIEMAAFDLDDVIGRAAQTFFAVAQTKGLSLDVVVADGAHGVWRGDAARLRQILCNLISNAVKFTAVGGVTVRAEASVNGLVMIVSDTGPGVSADQMPRLFEKFVQADASTTREFGGTGLGLSISRELVEMMDGTLTVEPAEPTGLVFRIDLPLTRVGGAATVIIDEPDGSQNAFVDPAALRVLAAEDHPVNRQVLSLLLGQVGITPHVVENGQEALDAWRDAHWDLILMDVQMPVMDGPTAARAIRAEEQATARAPTPIIALTANVMTHQLEAYRQAGMTGSVAKPIQVEALLQAIADAVPDPPAKADGSAAA